MGAYTNIAAYRFTPLSDLKGLRARLLGLCKSWELKGTILLSVEGINLFIAGSGESVACLLAELRSVPGLESLAPKVSESDHLPFTRMLVRIKKEIIAFGVEGIDPASRPSPKVSAATLKAWLDEGRDITLLDTRNDYEVKLGTFRNALPMDIQHFRDFPEAARRLPESLKEKPVVMFCTGGIRCEKAGPFMQREGFRNVFQLDGGILKYFEDCGGAHYEGECFVFDQRVGLDPSLQETESTQCFQCLSPLTPMEQRDPRFVPGRSCPHCHRSDQEQTAAALELHQRRLDSIRDPLPGGVPYDNYRPISVPRACDGRTALGFLRQVLPHIAESEWRQLAEQGLFCGPEKSPVGLDGRVVAGGRYYRKLPGLVEPDVDARVELLHEDAALIVLSKPAPLPMHPGGRFNRNTLEFL
ncbi:MAG: sulfurtransferase, partial [Verrucomicrobia bacterium]|nr:sulfurtransferase [Verrucomicrobiota bacterium]